MDTKLDEPARFEPLWSIRTTAEYLGISVATLYTWRCHRLGPRSYRVGGLVRYRPEEVRDWVDQTALVS
ncbi:MAG: helix-turn-helix transcriptional regulator [Nocardioidaceae bacterium]